MFNTMNKEADDQANRALRNCPSGAGPITERHWARRNVWRKSAAGLASLLLVLTTGGTARATYEYSWLTTSGPTVRATFRVPDYAITNGVLTAASMSTPPSFSASTPVGPFSNLTADSALEVDPVTGAVVASTNNITATNSTDTLLLSASGYFIPTSILQPRGRGTWRVTHVIEVPPPTQVSLLGFTNGQAQLKVTCTADTTFTIESSADLLKWTPILTNQIVGGVSVIVDPAPAGDSARFYRAVTGM